MEHFEIEGARTGIVVRVQSKRERRRSKKKNHQWFPFVSKDNKHLKVPIINVKFHSNVYLHVELANAMMCKKLHNVCGASVCR